MSRPVGGTRPSTARQSWAAPVCLGSARPGLSGSCPAPLNFCNVGESHARAILLLFHKFISCVATYQNFSFIAPLNEIDRFGTCHLYLFTTYSMLDHFVDAYLIIGFVFGISD